MQTEQYKLQLEAKYPGVNNIAAVDDTLKEFDFI